jgi:hypothetical protein
MMRRVRDQRVDAPAQTLRSRPSRRRQRHRLGVRAHVDEVGAKLASRSACVS